MTSLRDRRDQTSLTAASAKAQTLVEALPWLERFRGAVVVVKYGGNAMVDDELKAAFAQDMVFLRYAGLRPVVVHGGGPQIAAMLERVGIDQRVPRRAAGHHPRGRWTSSGWSSSARWGASSSACSTSTARSPSGCPVRTPTCSPPRKRSVVVDGEPVDIGLVGDVETVNPSAVTDILDAGRIPVVSTVAPDLDDGRRCYNVNADTAAAALAVALGARKLVVLTDVEGVYGELARPRLAALAHCRCPTLEELLPRSTRAWCRRSRPACAPCAGACRRRTSSTAASRTRCCSRCSPTRASAP